MNQLNKHIDTARKAKLNQRLVGPEQIIGIINKIPINNNYSILTKGSIMKLAAVFIPLITIFTIGLINANNIKTKEENRIEREKGIENGSLIKRPIFHPTIGELEDFGIYIEDGKVTIYTQRSMSWYEDYGSFQKIFEDKGYDLINDKYIYKKCIFDLSNWSTKNDDEFIQKNKIPNNKINKSAFNIRYKAQQVSGVSGLSDGAYNLEIGSLISFEIGDLANDYWEKATYLKDEEFIYLDTMKYGIVKDIIFVSIPFEIDGEITEMFVTMIPTNELYNSLPLKFKYLFDDYYSKTDYLDSDIEIPREVRVPLPKINKELLSEVSFIELNSDELQNIGIMYKDTLLSLTTSRPYKYSNFEEAQLKQLKDMMIIKGMDTTISEGYFYIDQEVSYTSTTGSEKLPVKNGTQTLLGPEVTILRSYIYGENDYYTYSQGTHVSVYDSKSEDKTELAVNSVFNNYDVLVINNMNTAYNDLVASYTSFGEPIIKYLLPVRVYIGDKDNKEDGNIYGDILLFYRPTEEFINALPPRYSEPLSKEFGIISDVEKGNINLGEACEALGGESYFGICSNNSFALMNLYPMPANNKLNLELISSNNQTINISVLNNSAKELIQLDKQLIGGKNKLNINISELKAGVYFLKITDDYNNSQLRTFIKK